MKLIKASRVRGFGRIDMNMIMYDYNDETVCGDEARLYWLAVVHEEIQSELIVGMTAEQMSDNRFRGILKKVRRLMDCAEISSGAPIVNKKM